MLVLCDLYDVDDIVLEVKFGEGGEEFVLFVVDLVRMYICYVEWYGWVVMVLDEIILDLGGYKDVMLVIVSKVDIFDGVWLCMKFEGGVYCV